MVDRRPPPAWIVDMDVTTSEPVLCRRRPILISNKRRRKRWLKDDDEDEIALDDTEMTPSANTFSIDDTSTILSDAISSDNITTLEIKHSVIPTDEEILISTTTNIEQSSFTTADPMVDGNVTESDRISTNELNVHQTTISNEMNDTIIDDLTEIPVTEQTSTMDTSILNTAITLLDYTAPFAATIDTDQIFTDSLTEILQENTTISDIDNTAGNYTEGIDSMLDNTTMSSETSQNGTEVVTDQDVDQSTTASEVTQYDTSTNVIDDEDEYSNETTTLAPTKPICDQSCQCLRKCHYGFEIINGTCQCDEPCKVSSKQKQILIY